MATRARSGRTTTPKPKPPIEESPRLLRSYVADLAAFAEEGPPVVELTPGQYFRFASRMPTGLHARYMEEITRESTTPAQAMDWLMAMVATEDRAGLEAALMSVVVPIPPSIVHDIRVQLLGFYSGRPTMPPPSSPSEPSGDGAASGPGASPTTTPNPQPSNRES